MEKYVKRTKAWLALLLLLHAVVHPFLHDVPLRALAYGAPTFSASAAAKDLPAHDCPLCRAAKSAAPAAAPTLSHHSDVSLQVVPQSPAKVLRVLQLRLSPRAPPAI